MDLNSIIAGIAGNATWDFLKNMLPGEEESDVDLAEQTTTIIKKLPDEMNDTEEVWQAYEQFIDGLEIEHSFESSISQSFERKKFSMQQNKSNPDE
jgi:hypothetical protein